MKSSSIIANCSLISADDMVVKANRQREEGFEPKSLKIWGELTKNRGMVVDIGMYTGLYTIIAAKNGCQAIGFEPNPASYDRALENFRANNVQPATFNVALWSDFAVLDLSMSDNKITSAASLMVTRNKRRPVVACPLDSFKFTTVKVIKIDAERAEEHVLKGAMGTIIYNKPKILIEVLDGPEMIDAMLCPLGYNSEETDKGMRLYYA